MAKAPAAKSAANQKPDLAERAFKLQAQYEEARKEAISQLLAEQSKINERLKALGHQVGPAARPSASASSKPCKICGEMGHDARKHRYEKKAAQ